MVTAVMVTVKEMRNQLSLKHSKKRLPTFQPWTGSFQKKKEEQEQEVKNIINTNMYVNE